MSNKSNKAVKARAKEHIGSQVNHASDNRPANELTFISMFSGIEAASVAFKPLGWRALAFAEIDKFPSAVLAHHYPDVPNVGDMSKHDWAQYRGKVDIVCGGPPCFTAGHLVLSEKGYVPIESIAVGDKVVTHKGRLRTVIRIGNARAEVGKITGVGICEHITCTPDHPFLSVKWRNQSTKRDNKYTKIETFESPEWVAANDMPGRQWCQLIEHDANDNHVVSTKFDAKTAMYVAGMYLGDGWIREHEGKRKKSITLGINPAKYVKLKSVIGDAVHTVSPERTTVKVTIHDTAFAEWLEDNFAHYSHLKTIPSWVMGHKYKSEFLRGFLDTDGHVKPDGKVSISTTSRSLAHGISDLLTAEGYVSGVAFVKTPETYVIEGRTVNQRDYYQVRAYPAAMSRKSRIYENMVLRAVSKFEPCGTDTVFNIEVDGDNSYIVQGAIVHNCQAFSVAGLRAGMDDPRGQLSINYMRALHAIKPRNAIVENVPGWLSSADNAFGAFLAGLVGADDALPPPTDANGKRRKWPNAGMVSGPKGRAAWRILDAQYFGLAQRRKRVIVVADFGNGADPASVLFERTGLSRNPPTRGKAGQDVAAAISARTKGGGGLGTDFDLDGGLVPAMTTRTGTGTGNSGMDEYIVPVATFDRQSNCEYGSADLASTVSARDYKSPTDLVAYAVQAGALRENPNSGQGGVGVQDGIAYTLEARAEVQAVCITGAQCVTGEITHALKAEGADASEDGTGRGNPIVAFGWQNSASQGLSDSEHISPTLDKSKTPAIAQTVALRGRDGGATAELGGEVATELRASGGGGDKAHVLTFAQDHAAGIKQSEISGTLTKEGPSGSAGGNGGEVLMLTSAVRRLTPVECERLQGFPDNYTNIPWRGKPHSPDGPRYKALGNSWAVPKFTWIGDRIARFMPPIAAVEIKDAA